MSSFAPVQDCISMPSSKSFTTLCLSVWVCHCLYGRNHYIQSRLDIFESPISCLPHLSPIIFTTIYNIKLQLLICKTGPSFISFLFFQFQCFYRLYWEYVWLNIMREYECGHVIWPHCVFIDGVSLCCGDVEWVRYSESEYIVFVSMWTVYVCLGRGDESVSLCQCVCIEWGCLNAMNIAICNDIYICCINIKLIYMARYIIGSIGDEAVAGSIGTLIDQVYAMNIVGIDMLYVWCDSCRGELYTSIYILLFRHMNQNHDVIR